jgi:hypothetical protein
VKNVKDNRDPEEIGENMLYIKALYGVSILEASDIVNGVRPLPKVFAGSASTNGSVAAT